jgi:hypothetical protein
VTIPASIAPTLAKLIRLLSSNQSGEVAAAAHAIDRTLKSNGADWHDLAAMLVAVPPPPSSPKKSPQEDWHPMREFCLQRSTRLRERELKFIASLANWRGDLTEKQFAWLSAIHERVRRQSK